MDTDTDQPLEGGGRGVGVEGGGGDSRIGRVDNVASAFL